MQQIIIQLVLLYLLIGSPFFGYSLLISTLWLGTGELAVFNKGILFLPENEIFYRFTIAFVASNIVMITISCLCLFISTISRNSVTPIIITISVVFIGTAISLIPIDFFNRINPYLFTGYINSFLVAFNDPIPWGHIRDLLTICIMWSGVFLALSFYFFLNRDIID